MTELKRLYTDEFEKKAIAFAHSVLSDVGKRVRVQPNEKPGDHWTPDRVDPAEPQFDPENPLDLTLLVYRDVLAGFASPEATKARLEVLKSVPEWDDRELLVLERPIDPTAEDSDVLRKNFLKTLIQSGKFVRRADRTQKIHLLNPLLDRELQLLKAGLRGIRGVDTVLAETFRQVSAMAFNFHPDLADSLSASLTGMEDEKSSGLRDALATTILEKIKSILAEMRSLESGLDWELPLVSTEGLFQEDGMQVDHAARSKSVTIPPLAPYGGLVPARLVYLQKQLMEQDASLAAVVASEAGAPRGMHREAAFKRLVEVRSMGDFLTLEEDRAQVERAEDNVIGFDYYGLPPNQLFYKSRGLILREERLGLQRAFCESLAGLPTPAVHRFHKSLNDLDHSMGQDTAFLAMHKLTSVHGDDSEAAWALRDATLEQFPTLHWIKTSVVQSLAGLNSERAWAFREEQKGQVAPEDLLLSINNAVVATLRAHSNC